MRLFEMMDRMDLYTGGGLFWEGIVNRYRESAFYEWLTALFNDLFGVHFHKYEHIPLGPSSNRSAQLVILAAVIALILASVIVLITKRREGRFVKKLLKDECFSPERAKSLSELGEFRSTFLRRALVRGGMLGKCVYCVRVDAAEASKEDSKDTGEAAEDVDETSLSADEGIAKSENAPTDEAAAMALELRKHEKYKLTGEGKIDFKTARFYIPEVLKYRAEVRYEGRDLGWVAVVLTVVLSLVGAFLVSRFLPDFIQLLDNLIGMTAPQ